jgi:hypothetical protein
MVEFDFSGRFIRHIALALPSVIPEYCPYRQGPIANWTTKAERRVAMALNRLEEIMIFRDQQLLFARRSGRWSFLTHKPIITQMGTGIAHRVRGAVYVSSLDASFARTGACVGIVDKAGLASWHNLVNKDDRVLGGVSKKAEAIRRITRGKTFQQLDRRIRQEMLAIDGATLLSDQGKLLAVGAILKISAGSTGGGRLAAAKALAQYGIGIKVSQDGGIIGFRRDRELPAFRLM